MATLGRDESDHQYLVEIPAYTDPVLSLSLSPPYEYTPKGDVGRWENYGHTA
jgi:hypothetical protein